MSNINQFLIYLTPLISSSCPFLLGSNPLLDFSPLFRFCLWNSWDPCAVADGEFGGHGSYKHTPPPSRMCLTCFSLAFGVHLHPEASWFSGARAILAPEPSLPFLCPRKRDLPLIASWYCKGAVSLLHVLHESMACWM